MNPESAERQVGYDDQPRINGDDRVLRDISAELVPDASSQSVNETAEAYTKPPEKLVSNRTPGASKFLIEDESKAGPEDNGYTPTDEHVGYN